MAIHLPFMPSFDKIKLMDSSSYQEENSLFECASEQSVATYYKSLYTAVGQKILLDRLNTGRDFCKLMLILSLGAIPVYLLLFIMAIPYDSDAGKTAGMMILSPALLFLITAIVFAAGFLWVTAGPISDSVNEIERASRKIILRRNQFIALGSLCFLSASIVGMVGIVKAHL
ncbi:MAG TPA: hypothetical protein V6D07_11100 [Trichocoleus sp.]